MDTSMGNSEKPYYMKI